MAAQDSVDNYTGPERRSGEERRQTPDRRQSIRWEPNKDDRRSGEDRRKSGTGNWNKYWGR